MLIKCMATIGDSLETQPYGTSMDVVVLERGEASTVTLSKETARELAQELLSWVGEPGLEARVAALEARVAALEALKNR